MYDRSDVGTDDAVNLGRFLAGSEGSLAITTAASIRLVEPPGGRSLLVLGCRRFICPVLGGVPFAEFD